MCSCQRLPDLQKHGQMDRQLLATPALAVSFSSEKTKSLLFVHFFPTTFFSPVRALAFRHTHRRKASASEMALWVTSHLVPLPVRSPPQFSLRLPSLLMETLLIPTFHTSYTHILIIFLFSVTVASSFKHSILNSRSG